MSDIGPVLPPHLAAKRKRQQEEAQKAAAEVAASSSLKNTTQGKASPDSGSRSIGPTRPPSAATTTTTTATSPKKDVDENPEKRRRVVGPSLPAPIDQMPSRGPNGEDNHDSDSESSSDDDIGPALPGSARSAAEEEAAAQRRLAAYGPGGSAGKPEKLTRDEWMIVPPKQEDWSSRVDPTKIKARKFQSGKGAKAPGAKGGDNTLWTETAADKAKRVADEVMGVRKPVNQVGEDENPAERAARLEAEAMQQRIDDFNTKNRGQSLMERHSTSKDRKEEDDPSKRAFDREKDIVGSSKKIGHAQKQQMLSRAADFGSRFSKGNYL